jgi:dihydrolipoamide dehydrogenase
MYDLSIIGAGWAGLNAALAAKELGLKVCLIERAQLGGTCLNLGCIPTKTLIQSAKVFALSKKSDTFGIEIANSKIDFHKVQERKDRVIQQLRSGLESILKNIDLLNQDAKILSHSELEVQGKLIETKSILIATGSQPAELNGFKFDSKRIISSDDILNLKEIPNSLLIIGGGVIGCEFATLFSTLGTQVTIAEKMPQLIPGEDKEIAKKIETIFKKKGIKVNTDTDAATLDLKSYELILVCVGRMVKTAGLGIEKLGIKTDKGKIVVDDYLKTNIENIYAAGDCTGKIMLAHFASYQGIMAAKNIACPANPQKVNHTAVPNCIFTDPEIASVGQKEADAKSKGLDIKISKFDFLGSGVARILDERDGFIKIISDQKTGEILGGSIIGPRATELIAILTLAVSARLDISGIRNTIFAHPTLSESIGEALK